MFVFKLFILYDVEDIVHPVLKVVHTYIAHSKLLQIISRLFFNDVLILTVQEI